MTRKILIVDDSTTVRRVVEHALGGPTTRVLCAADGASALDLARREQPDLILCDVVMPGLSGYEVVEALARDPALRDIPALLLTGAFEPFDETRATRCGAVGHLAKPFESRTLRERVEELLARRAPRAPTPATTEAATGGVRPPVEQAAATARWVAPGGDEEPLGGVDALAPPGWIPTRVPLPGDEDFDLSRPAGERPLAAHSARRPAVDGDAWREECRRQVGLLAPEIIREVAWEVVPDLLERLLRESAPPPPAAPDAASDEPPEPAGERPR